MLSSLRFSETCNMVHGAPVARETPAIINIIKCHFLKLMMPREERKEETIKMEWLCMFKSKKKNITWFVTVYKPKDLTGLLKFLRGLNFEFFSNRKNSQI